MSSYEKLIGDAIINPDKADLSLDRVDCKLYASTNIFCRCGTILDQKSIHVLYNITLDKIDGACCPACKDYIEEYIKVNNIKSPFLWKTWKGRKTINTKKD